MPDARRQPSESGFGNARNAPGSELPDLMQELGHAAATFDAAQAMISCNAEFSRILGSIALVPGPGMQLAEIVDAALIDDDRETAQGSGTVRSDMAEAWRNLADLHVDCGNNRHWHLRFRKDGHQGRLLLLSEPSTVPAMTNDYTAMACDWFWETDSEHRFVRSAATEGYNGRIDEFVGLTRWQAVGGDAVRDPMWRAHRAALMDHQPFRDFRYQHISPDGQLRRSRISGSPIFDRNGTFVGYRGAGFDETPQETDRLDAARAQLLVHEAINSIQEGVAILDSDGRLTLWNNAFESIYASSRSEFRIGMSFREMARVVASSGLVDLRGRTVDQWATWRTTLPQPNPETAQRQIDGRWYQVRETGLPAGGMAILMADITVLKSQEARLISARDSLAQRVEERSRSLADAVDREKAEASRRSEAEHALIDSEKKFRAIAEGTVQGFYVQNDFNLVYVNPALAELLNYPSVDHLLQIGSVSNFLAPGVREQLRKRSETRMAGGDEPTRYETQFLSREGRIIWVELFVSEIDWDGRKSVLVSVVDIDRQKRAVEALAEAERDYRALFEHSSDGIYRSTISGRNIRANPALVRMNGFETEEEAHRANLDVEGSWYVEPGRRAQFVEIMLRDGQVRDFVSEVYRYKTRERMWISENAHLVRDDTGRPLFFEGSIRDITGQRQVEIQLRRAMEEAERASHAKSQFLAKMSHELRTPLNAIIGFSDILAEQMMGPIGSERYLSYAGDIRSSGTHLLSLINDLLDLSRIEAGQAPVSVEPVDLHGLLQECEGLMAPLATARGIGITLDVATGFTIRADRRSMKQVLINLMSNAVKYNQDNGHVTITVGRADNVVNITVADTGVGIAAQDVEILFTPFGRVTNQLVADREGSGLGLPIVKGLMELLGGSVHVESTPGEGTSVHLTLPDDD